jgi:23S rRNA (uracil1939-C5)-methyltransferase
VRKKPIFEKVTITDIADRGKAVGKNEAGMVIFIDNVVPGDVVDALALRKKKGIWHGVPVKYRTLSPHRVEPVCQHFDDCGGCKWQHFDYTAQTIFKEKSVREAMQRIAKVEIGAFLPIIKADPIYQYRNKLEYSFSSKRWKTKMEIQSDQISALTNALGFHPPGNFEKVVEIEKCWLQHDDSNRIRNFIKTFARNKGLTFFDPKEHKGTLRNIILRNNTRDEWMVIIAFFEDDPEREALLHELMIHFPQIKSLYYVINRKKNDTLFDQDLICFKGKPCIVQELDHLQFKIGPKSFFQTNPSQTLQLYRTAKSFCGLKGSEVVYDLYTGLGSIALFVADACKTVVGIEEVEAAIEDAKENAKINNVTNVHFYPGQIRKILTQEFEKMHGKPDVVIVDPPRMGMHEQVVLRLLEMSPDRIVYISCNPSTQARDIGLFSKKYAVIKVQPVDMFPHTSHIESIALLQKKTV